MADKLGSYEFAFYAAGSLMLLSGAVQFLMLCIKSSVNADQTRRELVSMVDPQSTSENNQDKDHKEYLSSLYVESTLRKNDKKSASVESMQFLWENILKVLFEFKYSQLSIGKTNKLVGLKRD